MIYYKYSPEQLEQKAEALLRQFDEERLTRIKPIDVYAVIEKCLDVPYDWKYLTPDQSILGMTAFKSGFLWVWPTPYYRDGILPYKISVDAGTILIDGTLTEATNRGPENFTVMHEVFHQVLHKRCFAHSNPDYTHTSTKRALESHMKPLSSLEICEYQANACAAAFLMPRNLVADRLKHYGVTYTLDFSRYKDREILSILADEFSVSKTAMKYRLIHLKHAVPDK